MTLPPKRKILITGAAGGMGRACARLFGATDDLVLTDIGPALATFADELRSDGYTVVDRSGDLGDDKLVRDLVDEVSGEAPFAVVHAAGLSPSLADWRAIMQVNLIATVKLLDMLEAKLIPGCVVVLIASSAGHMLPALPEVDALLAEPLRPDFLDKVEAIIKGMGGESSPGGMGGLSYTLSKRAVLALVRRRAIAWGPRGVRIASISPGMILTPMGKSEMANTSGAAELLDSTPIGRAGTAMDIALAARFLVSKDASFITGADLLVDGGGTAGILQAMARAATTGQSG